MDDFAGQAPQYQSTPRGKSSDEKTDPWTSKAYQASSSFVPLLTTKIIEWLDPRPNEHLLDLGCGDGILTAKIKEQCTYVCGLDGSPNLIEAAKKSYGHLQGIDWEVKDCRYLDHLAQTSFQRYDKIFSNAALHWILRDPTTRQSVIRDCYSLLKPNGTFVFEMGGAGNVAEVHGALISALVHLGVSIHDAREACPWFFPSETLMRQLLESERFRVEKSELQYRPTRLTEEEGGGLEGWVKLHGDSFLRVLMPGKRESAVQEVCEALKSVLTHDEDGSMWIGYVRLRMVATKTQT